MASMRIAEEEEPIDDLDEANEVIPYNYSITAYGADYPVDALVKRIEANDIIVPRFNWQPNENSEIVGFQREYVWPRKKADRFIESLLLGLPVPGIFLVKELSGRFLVLDGHQRLNSLHAFYQGIIDGVEYRLDSVQQRFQGKRYKDLGIEDQRRINDSIIHATVIRQDEPTEDQSSIYMIFERLNTGGVNLQPQEIRVALYHGELVRVLQELNDNASWRTLYGNKSKRLKDLEMILRFFAFFYHERNYRSPMKDFLNRYMASNQSLNRQSEKDLKRIFTSTVSLLSQTVGAKTFRPERAINAAVIDSVMTGLARRLQSGGIIKPDEIIERHAALLRNEEYRDAVETGTSQKAKVETRFRLAMEAFASIK
ncbi:MAG: DUF262 domain-containing protein [Elusimicrobia bacterium]|nr:DUF262 domain-containing protein [Elusimicrobiota bacterium]